MSVGLPSGTLTIALLAFAAASALGATVTQAPTISGDPSPGPGSVLTATPGDWTPAGATAGYDWLRCTGADLASCKGRYTRVKTLRGKAPLRIDRCLMPGSTRPVRCPTA